MFLVRIVNKTNNRKRYTLVARHMAGTAIGSVQLVKQFSTEVMLDFPNTQDLNKFLKGGNDQWSIEAIDRPKVYFTQGVIQVWDGNQFFCQAAIWPEGDESSKTTIVGPKKDSAENARKAFWFFWNHGNHSHKTEEGASARLVRYKTGYQEVIVT